MDFKVAAVAALLSAAGAAATGSCGVLNGPCCNIADNNPNIGDCDAQSSCWEGTCMECGKDGKPVCNGALPLRRAPTAGLLPCHPCSPASHSHSPSPDRLRLLRANPPPTHGCCALQSQLV